MSSHPLCPRCGRYLPSDEAPGSSLGVPSLDPERTAMVCDGCAWHETWLSTSGQDFPAQWPVVVPSRFYGVMPTC